jgi:oligopeptide/dipeptide ABC transporter ATP-binding protein
MLVSAVSATLESLDSNSASGDVALLEVNDLVQTYVVNSPGTGRRVVQAVSGVSFTMRAGETLTLVGESGCGKSSLARAVLQLPRPTSGSVEFKGRTLTDLHGRELAVALRGVQMIFQDPYGSLDPHWKIGDLVAEPLRINGVGSKAERALRADHLLEIVGLSPLNYRDRHPRELSGGQCQRVAIARALALDPNLLVCDEPVSSLDVSIQAQILNLFEDLRKELQLSYLFITHDLAIAKHVSDRIAVMYLGKIVEIGDAARIYTAPQHPYASALLEAIPDPDAPQTATPRVRLSGELPSASNPPSGCRFRTRCPLAQDICAEVEPPLRQIGNFDHAVACHFPLGGKDVPVTLSSGPAN